MAESVNAFGQTIRLIFEIITHGVQGAYQRLAPKAGVYLKSLLYVSIVALITIPVLGILKAFTGYIVFGYLMALLGIFFILILGLMWAPLSLLVGLLLGETNSAKAVGEKYVRIVATILFIELMASMYISYIPLHRQPAMIPIFFIAATLVALGSFLWGGFFSGRFYTFIALLVAIKISLSSFFPQTATNVTEWWGQLDGQMAQGCNAPAAPDRTPARSPPTRPAPRKKTDSQSSPTLLESAPQRIKLAPIPTNQDQLVTKVVRVAVKPNWTAVSLPQHTKFECTLAGWADFLLPDSTVTYVDGSKKLSLNHSGPTNFQIRGAEGVAIFTLQ